MNGSKKVQVVLTQPESTPSIYATNLVVHHTKHEFSISFFEVKPPLLYGPPEEKQKVLEATDTIESKCLVRVVVAASRMGEFVTVLQENLKTYLASVDEVESGK